MKAIDVGKTVTIDAGKKLVEKAAKRLSTPKSQVVHDMVPPTEITKKINEVIVKYVDTCAINLNKLIDESSVKSANAPNAIAIASPRKTDKRFRSKSNINCISSSIKNDGRYVKIYRYPNY